MTYQSETISAEVQISSQASLVMAQSTPPSSQKRGQVWSFSTKKNNFWCKFALWTDPKKLQDEESGERHQSFAWLQHVSSKSLPPPFHPFFWGGWQLKYFLFPPRTLGKWSNLTQRSLNWLKPPSRKGWRWHQNTHLWPREREREREMMVGLISTLRCYNFSVTWLQTRHHLP